TRRRSDLKPLCSLSCIRMSNSDTATSASASSTSSSPAAPAPAPAPAASSPSAATQVTAHNDVWPFRLTIVALGSATLLPVAGALPELGVKWVAPRGGAGGFRDASWSRWTARDSVKRYHDAGLRVYPWIFSRPWAWQNEVLLFQQFIDEGADGVIIDAEALW